MKTYRTIHGNTVELKSDYGSLITAYVLKEDGSRMRYKHQPGSLKSGLEVVAVLALDELIGY